jgi:hypothetical protein
MTTYSKAFVYQLYITVEEGVSVGHSTSQGYAVVVSIGGIPVIEPTTGRSTSQGHAPIQVGILANVATTGESDSKGWAPTVIPVAPHGCRNAVYWSDNRRPNMVLVIGKETAVGNMVFGYAEDGTESERDPILYWYANGGINSFDYAEDVSVNLLSKLRLLSSRGQMLIFPNIGQEQWDVIGTVDTVTNTNTKLRVSGWTLRWDREAEDGAEFIQLLNLTNV